MPLVASLSSDDMQGTWKLLSFNVYAADDPDGKSLGQPLGPNPMGRAVFSSTFMSAILTDPERAKPLNAASLAQASKDEVVRVAKAMTSYCGPYKVYRREGEIRLETQVEISLDPNWMGKSQIRRATFYERDGRRFVTLKPLQLLELPNGIKAVGVLDWEKVD